MAESAISHHSAVYSPVSWREVFQRAERETNPQKLPSLITAAEEAIFIRWQQLTRQDGTEREELAEATVVLWGLRGKLEREAA